MLGLLTPESETELDIAAHGPGPQVWALEHESGVPAHQLLRRAARLTEKANCPGVRRLEHCEDSKQRGLAGTVWSKHREDFSAPDLDLTDVEQRCSSALYEKTATRENGRPGVRRGDVQAGTRVRGRRE